MSQTRRRAIRVAGAAAAVLFMTAGGAATTNRGRGTALAAQQHTARTVPYTETATCAQISHNGSTSVQVCAGTNLIYGNVAAVATITLNGLSGTDTSIEYDANGSRRVKETCTGGTGVHKNEKCSYTLSGTTNPQTNVSSSKEVGTATR